MNNSKESGCFRYPRSVLSAAFICVLAFGANSGMAFGYPDFSSTAGLSLVGTAARNVNVLRLTPAGSSQMGSAWYTQPQPVTAGFTTTFGFRFTNPTPPGADGISFNLQSLGINALADEQGTSSGISISFNTFLYGDEPSDNYVGIFRNGFANSFGLLHSFDLNPTPIRLNDGNVHNAALTYNGSAFNLSIDGLSIFNNLALSLNPGVDSNGNSYVGFGARTGSFWQNQDVLNWSFTPVPEPSSFSLLGFAFSFILIKTFRKSCRAS
jgi:hypothetical protein